MTQFRPHRVHPLPLMGGHHSGVQECPTYNERYIGYHNACDSVVLYVQLIPSTSSYISRGQAVDSRPQYSFIPSYINHIPITITANADFVSKGFPGNGILGDPYVITGYNITATESCISIQDTDAYFVIRDCLLFGTDRGVELDNVTNGEIRNNTISGNYHGVYLYSSSNNTIVDNTLSGNDLFGVNIFISSNNTVVNNTINTSDYSVRIISSSNITVQNNIISGSYVDGVLISQLSYTTITDNTISDNGDFGIFLGGGTRTHTIYNNIFADNSGGNAFDNGINNTRTVNFWSDYSGYGDYPITGGSDSVDHDPSIYPFDIASPIFTQPEDIEYVIGTNGQSITWIVNETCPSYYWIYENGVLVVSETWNGSPINIVVDGLSLGVHNFTIYVYDNSENCAYDSVLVFVTNEISTELISHATDTATKNDDDDPVLFLTYICIVSIEVLVVVIIISKFRKHRTT